MSEFGGFGWTGWLWAGLRWFGSFFGLGGVNDQLKLAVRWLKSRLFEIWEAVTRALQRLGLLAKVVASIFKRLWTDIIRPFIAGWVKWIQNVAALLKKWLDPIVRFIRAIRDNIMRIYERFVRPVLDAIDIARRVLRIAAALGLDWAKALEEKLTRVTEIITEPFLKIVAKLNEAIDWINRIITIDGLLQRFTLFRSLWMYRRIFVNFTINTGYRKATQAEKDYVFSTPERPSIAARRAAVINAAQGRDAAINARVSETVAEILASIRF